MPDEIPQAIPVVRLLVDVGHAAAEGGLQVVGVVAEEVHDGGPAGGGEDGPGVVRYAGGHLLARHEGEARTPLGLDGEPGEREHHAREHVDDDLLVDARDLAALLGAPPEDGVPAQQPGGEGVVPPFLAGRRAVVLEQVARQLVDEGEPREVPRVRLRRAQHEGQLLLQGARPEQEHHDQRVREPHLGPVHGAVPRALGHGQQVVVRRVEDHALEGRFRRRYRGRHVSCFYLLNRAGCSVLGVRGKGRGGRGWADGGEEVR